MPVFCAVTLQRTTLPACASVAPKTMALLIVKLGSPTVIDGGLATLIVWVPPPGLS